MKYVILIVIAAVLAPLMLAGCSPGGGSAEDWTYVGTWANADYDGGGGSGPPGKIILTSTSVAAYDYVTDTEWMWTGIFAVTDDWTSGDMHYFKGIAVIDSELTYFLMRVQDNNNTLESNSSPEGYPATIEPEGDEHYGIYARQ